MFRSLSLGLVSAIAFISAADAADIYRAPAVGGYKDGPIYANTWTGFYIGASVGGAFDDLKIKDIDGYAAGATPGTKTSLSPDGVIAGGTLGYNMQSGSFVYGIEGDLGYLGLSDKKLLTGTASGTKVGIDSGLYGDVTGRLGYAFGRALIYAKGGFAFYDGEDKFSTVTGSFSRKTSTDTFTGYTIGGGLEYQIAPAWSIKGEYQYFDFGSQDFTVFTAGGTPFRFKEDLTVNTVKFGVNYHLTGDYVPLK